jgi:hypothetical protein
MASLLEDPRVETFISSCAVRPQVHGSCLGYPAFGDPMHKGSFEATKASGAK